MKKSVIIFMLGTVATASSAMAEVNVNVSIGAPAPRVIVASPPAVRFEAPPLFIAPPQLGFYVAVDTPYDLVFSSDFFYLYYGNSWHRARQHNGPWVEVPYRELPPAIRKYRIEKIRSYRDREYRTYRNDRDHYRGRSFRPDHERRELIKDERRHDKQEMKEEHRHDKQEMNDERRHDRDEHKEERRDEKRDERQHGHGRD